MRRGTTLLEMALVLLIVGIVTAMAVPALAAVRDRLAALATWDAPGAHGVLEAVAADRRDARLARARARAGAARARAGADRVMA